MTTIAFNEQDRKALKDMYDIMKYGYYTSEEFARSIQLDWYHFDMFERDVYENTDEYIHAWKPGYKDAVIEFYKELLKNEPPIIEPGKTGCAVVYYSDKRAATITAVKYSKRTDEVGNKIPSQVSIRFNQTKCEDYYAGNYKVLDELQDGEEVFTFRKNHRWYNPGCPAKRGEVHMIVGHRHHYIDPNF